MADGNDISATTVRRWRDEIIGLLAARAPRLDHALKKIAKQGGEVVLIDGTLIPTQRRTGAANRPNYSGKHHRHGLHVLALTDERGRIIWISATRPGRTHDITAARCDQILAHLRAAGLGALADLGFVGLDDDPDDPVLVTGFKATRARKLTTGQKEANQVLAAARAPVEHGLAHLKHWRILTKLRTDPARATHRLRALPDFKMAQDQVIDFYRGLSPLPFRMIAPSHRPAPLGHRELATRARGVKSLPQQ